MSAVAGPERLADRPRLPRARRLAVPVRVHPDAGLTVGLALVLSALAFYARGGVANEPNTYAEVLLVAGAAVLGALAIAGPSRYARLTRFYGATALAGFALLALLTALSILWSLDPSASWLETNRTLAYLATFAAGISLVRIAPDRWAAVLHAVALAAVIVCAYALATKVWPDQLAEDEIFARLRAPFGYWNAVGLMAASGVPPLLWLAARRTARAGGRRSRPRPADPATPSWPARKRRR